MSGQGKCIFEECRKMKCKFGSQNCRVMPMPVKISLFGDILGNQHRVATASCLSVLEFLGCSDGSLDSFKGSQYT